MGENGLLQKMKGPIVKTLATATAITTIGLAQAESATPQPKTDNKTVIINNYYESTPNQFWFNNYAWQFDRFVANNQRLYFRRMQRGAWVEFYLHMNDLPRYNLYFNAQIGIPYYRQNYYNNYYPPMYHNNQPFFNQNVPMKKSPRIIRNNPGRRH